MRRFVSKLFKAKPAGTGQLQREGRELRRLESLIDTVFAIVIVGIVLDLPAPEESVAFDLASFVVFRLNSLVIALLGVIVVLVYWCTGFKAISCLEISIARTGRMRRSHCCRSSWY